MKALSLVKLVTCIMLFVGILLVTACDGFTVTPNGDGGVTVTPNENENNNGNGGNSGTPDNGNNGENPDNKDPEVDLHSHVYQLVDSENSASSCTEDGIRTWRCECGSEFTETFAALGHDIRFYEGKDATCTEDGYKPYEKCIRGDCGYTTYESIPATGHQLNQLEDIEATCITDGFTDRVECTADGCSYYSETIVAALGHIRSSVEGRQPTCTEDGYSSYDICVRSGCTSAELQTPSVIPALGHDNVIYEAKEPTCTEFGWYDYSVCQRCSFSTYQQIEATGHTFDNGYCACGYADLGLHEHIWSDGYIVLSATCIDSGIKGYTCMDENCGDTKTEIIPALGHDNESHAAKEATCTSEGWYAYDECRRCGYSTFASIPMRDHNYIGFVTQQPTCTLSGTRTYTCSCGDVYDVEIEKLGHDWGNWYTTKDATCEASGQEQKVCMNNSAHVDIRTLSKLGHDWGEWTIISAPTCSQPGQEKHICKSNSAHIEIREIPTTEHITNAATGQCSQCGKQLSYKLDAPTISSANVDSGLVYWDTVEGADHYEVYIEPSGDYRTTKQTYINLEEYYGANTQIKVKIRAMPMASSPLMSSSYCEYVYDIPGSPIVNSKGIGNAVNLLTGSYTEFASGTTSIFNELMFNRLRVSENSMKTQSFESIYQDNLYGYVQDLSTSIGEKINASASVGVDKIANITSGYTFEVEDSFEKQTQSQTNAVFYDLNYMYAYKGVEIYGYNDTEKLTDILSDEFKEDAMKVQINEMTPEEFISKYGTHIITAATYGATFNLHYEMISNDGTIKTAFGTNVEEGIKNQLSATLYGINIGAESGVTTETSLKALSSFSDSKTYSKFVMRSSGGNATGKVATSLSEFAGAFESWSASLDDSTDYVIIDVPDGSLFFVWDFLGDDYAEAKAILHKYFYTCCDEQYYSIKDKISDMYKDSLTFDEETGTVTVNFSGLQNYTSAKLEGIKYERDGNTWFDSNTGVFTVYSMYNGMDVKKVVFEGAYGTKDGSGQTIEEYFNSFCIKFDKWWSNDIVIEFKHFAYKAGSGQTALDFSNVSSANITIIADDNLYINGGDGKNSVGGTAINAAGKNLTINGDGIVNIRGGNGSGGSSWGVSGKNGGDGIKANDLLIDISGTLTVTSGNGGNGYIGVNGTSGKTISTYTLVRKVYGIFNAHIQTVYVYDAATTGTDGGNGGNGGNAGAPIVANITVTETGKLIIKYGNGGSGGDGGRGGNGGNGHDYYGYADGISFIHAYDPGKGGDGGDGGDGGNAGRSVTITYSLSGDNIEIQTGRNGSVGEGGRYGDCGWGGCGGSTEATANSHSVETADHGKNGDWGKDGGLNP